MSNTPALAVGQRVQTTTDLNSAEWAPGQPPIPAGSLGTVDGVTYSHRDPAKVTSYSVRLDASVHPLSCGMDPGEVEPAEETVPIADLEEATARITALARYGTARDFRPFTAQGDVRPTGWTFRNGHGLDAERYGFVTRLGRSNLAAAGEATREQAEAGIAELYRAGGLATPGEYGMAVLTAMREQRPEEIAAALAKFREADVQDQATG